MGKELISYEGLVALVLAVGALGTASYGVVDNFKLNKRFSLAGFHHIFLDICMKKFSSRMDSGRGEASEKFQKYLDGLDDRGTGLDPLLPALYLAYGGGAVEMLKAQYLAGRSQGDLPRSLRQGVRIGIDLMDDETMKLTVEKLGLYGIADSIKSIMAKNRDLRKQAGKTDSESAMKDTFDMVSGQVTDEERAAIARLETTIDARIDAAFVLAEEDYAAKMRGAAMLAAISISLAIAYFVANEPGNMKPQTVYLYGFLIGLAAVPMAPIAKDLSTAIQEAVKAYKAK